MKFNCCFIVFTYYSTGIWFDGEKNYIYLSILSIWVRIRIPDPGDKKLANPKSHKCVLLFPRELECRYRYFTIMCWHGSAILNVLIRADFLVIFSPDALISGQDVDVLDTTMPMILRGWITCLLQVSRWEYFSDRYKNIMNKIQNVNNFTSALNPKGI